MARLHGHDSYTSSDLAPKIGHDHEQQVPRQRLAPSTFSIVLLLLFLFLLDGQVGVVSGHPSTTVAVKHQAVHIRKLLINGNTAGSNSAAAAMTADLCSEQVVTVSQGSPGILPSGIPSYCVTITNTCLGCTVRDVHVSCGEFASTQLLDPSDFRRLSYDDFIVKNGGPMGPGATISFEYSNSFIYNMNVVMLSCRDA